MNKDQQTYQASDILRYVNGEMSPQEMRALELHALNDPFLQDAIDGYHEVEKDDPAVLEGLRAVEAYKPSQTKVIPLWRRKVISYAAAAAVVLGAGWFVFNLSQPDQKLTGENESQIVVKQKDTSAGSAIVAPKATTVPADENTSSSLSLSKEQTTDQTLNPSVTTGKPEAVASAPSEKNEEQTNSIAGAEIMNNELSQQQAKTSKASAPSVAKASPGRMDFRFSSDPSRSTAASVSPVEVYADRRMFDSTGEVKLLAGKVYDNEQYPLENITIRQKGKSTTTITDELGRFQMTVPDTGIILIASGLGYITKEFRYNNQQQPFVLELKPSPQSLSETVVTNLAMNRKRAAKVDIDTSEAVPDMPWSAFEDYLTENIKMGESLAKQKSVVVAFEIGSSGKPESFEILQSGGKALDEEAMRLLKNGPAWKNKTGEKSPMAKVTVGF